MFEKGLTKWDFFGILIKPSSERQARASRGETGAILENDIEKNGKKQSDSEERNARLSVGADGLDED